MGIGFTLIDPVHRRGESDCGRAVGARRRVRHTAPARRSRRRRSSRPPLTWRVNLLARSAKRTVPRRSRPRAAMRKRAATGLVRVDGPDDAALGVDRLALRAELVVERDARRIGVVRGARGSDRRLRRVRRARSCRFRGCAAIAAVTTSGSSARTASSPEDRGSGDRPRAAERGAVRLGGAVSGGADPGRERRAVDRALSAAASTPSVVDQLQYDLPRARRGDARVRRRNQRAERDRPRRRGGDRARDRAPSSPTMRTAPVLERARTAGIAAEAVTWDREHERRPAYDARLIEAVERYEPELVLLLGWMHLVPAAFLDRFPETLNTHPAFLPFDPRADDVTMPDGIAHPRHFAARMRRATRSRPASAGRGRPCTGSRSRPIAVPCWSGRRSRSIREIASVERCTPDQAAGVCGGAQSDSPLGVRAGLAGRRRRNRLDECAPEDRFEARRSRNGWNP